MQVGDRLELTIERPAFGGGVIARAPDGRVVFLRGAAPGDRVAAELIEVKKRFARGRIIDVTPGETRAEPFCPHVEACGGCPWMTIPIADQRAALQAHVERELRDLGPTVFEPIATAAPTRAWRSTARLHWQDGALGYRAAGSQAVVDIDRCPVLRPPLDAMYAALRARVGPHLSGEGSVRLTADPDAPSGTLALHAQSRLSDETRQALRALLDAADSPIHGIWLDDGTASRGLGRVHAVLDGVKHPAQSFVQAHRDGNRALTAAVVEAVCAGPEGPVLELFAGSGNFTFGLARAGRAVTAVEIDPAAGAALSAAAVEQGVGSRVRTLVADAGRLAADLDWPHGRPTVALLDPPRAGARWAIDRLAALPGLRRVVYISCNPATLRRDARRLAGRGWRLARARAFDLFPHTGHVEALAVFERAK